MHKFYSTVSKGLFSISTVDVFDTSVDPSKIATFSTLAAIGKKSDYDYHVRSEKEREGSDLTSCRLCSFLPTLDGTNSEEPVPLDTAE
jgi:hypothetical protein